MSRHQPVSSDQLTLRRDKTMVEHTLYRSKLLQNLREHDEFIELLKKDRVTSYLEIGSMFGGSLWKVANALPKGSRVVSVDFAVDTPEALPHLQACVKDLKGRGYDAHLVVGDSADQRVIQLVKRLGPFGCGFIDGAHTLEAVMSDWLNYSPMCDMVAFHDIAWNDTWRSSVPGRPFKAMGVPDVWNEVKKNYRHVELKYQEPSNYYGVGVLWR